MRFAPPRHSFSAGHRNEPDVYQGRAAIPGELNRTPVPMISVLVATAREYRDDPDFERFQTCIWFQSARDRKAALRIARELVETGVGIVYPGDRNLVIHYGERHQIVKIGFAPRIADAAAEDDEDA